MTYSPKPGSKPEAAIRALQDGPMPTAALAQVMGLEPKQVHQFLAAAIKAGVVAVEKVGGRSQFRLGAGPAAADIEPESESAPPPVQMCMWADGEVDLFNVEMLERGDGAQFVRLTRDQVQQVVALATGLTWAPGA